MVHSSCMGKRASRWSIALLTAALLVVGVAEVRAQFEARSVDGSGNNIANPQWGMAGTQLLRLAPEAYGNGIDTPAGGTRISPREVSNMLSAQMGDIPNSVGASDWIWQWGQFLDHDIDLTPDNSAEPLPISVPAGDPFFDPGGTGTQEIGFNRSITDPSTGTGIRNPRQQLNLITSFIDASNVYGSDALRAATLRTNDGTGRLASTKGGLALPFNTDGLANAGGPDPSLYLAGDVRANEQIALTATHTLFMREHNRLAAELADNDPSLTGEEIYQQARKIVGALIQVITYNEFLPILLGPGALPDYAGYDDSIEAGISNEFSTGAYRYGHSMLSETLLRANKSLNQKANTSLRDAFFNPKLLFKGGGIEALLLGLTTQQAQEVDTLMVDGVRNFLFGLAGSGGFDLASLNLQRGRDHGLSDYNAVRFALRLRKVKDFDDITSNPALQAKLAATYSDVDDIDLWISGLAEDHVAGALVGATFHAIMVDQFTRLRDGDRFWYQNDSFFTNNPGLMNEVEATTLGDIIRRNTNLEDEMLDDAFTLNN